MAQGVFEGFAENPAAATLPLPYPVVTAMNFISSSAISSRLFNSAAFAAASVLFSSDIFAPPISAAALPRLEPCA